MGLTYLVGIAAVVVSLRVRVLTGSYGAGVRTPTWLVAMLVASLVTVSWIVLHALDMANAWSAMPRWQRDLPLEFFNRGYVDTRHGATLETIVQVASLAQTALLGTLAFALQHADRRRPVTAIVVLGASVLALEAWFSRVAGPDIFAYVAFALSAHPYVPDAIALPGTDATIGHLWGRPLVPCPYGPMWLVLARIAVAPFSTLAAQLFAFRAVGAIAMAGCAGALVAARKPVTAAIFALDPALWQLYVAEAHNDVVGIAFVLAAVAVRRCTPAAIVLVALAGAVKLPFLAIGVVVFASAASVRARLVPACVAVVASVALSFAFGGGAYVAAMRLTAEIYAHPLTPFEVDLHVALGAIGLGALAAAIVGARFFWGAPWSFVAFGQYPLGQYLGWGIPYAVLDETQGLLYLVLLPTAGFELSLLYPNAAFMDAGRGALLATLCIFLLVASRPRRAPPPFVQLSPADALRSTIRR